MSERPSSCGRRAFLKTVAASGVAAIGLDLLSGVRSSFAAAREKLPDGVHEAWGDVRKNDHRIVVKGDEVHAGDTIELGRDSSAIIVIEGSAFLLREKTVVQFIGTPPTRNNDQKVILKLQGIRMKRGQLLAVLPRDFFRVTTPTAVLASQGASVYLEAEPELTYLCVCKGRVDIQPAMYASVRETVVANFHEKPRYILGSCAGKPVLPAPFMHHGDEDITLLQTHL